MGFEPITFCTSLREMTYDRIKILLERVSIPSICVYTDTHRDTDTQTHIQTHTDTHTDTYRQTDRQTHITYDSMSTKS